MRRTRVGLDIGTVINRRRYLQSNIWGVTGIWGSNTK